MIFSIFKLYQVQYTDWMTNLEKIFKDYANKHIHLQDPHRVKSGKEATVFAVTFKDTSLALKVYIDPEVRLFQKNQSYIEGKYFRSSSERKAVEKQTREGKKIVHLGWVRREFFLLNKLHKMGASVPKVYGWTDDSILMEFIGAEEVAPRLVGVELTQQQAETAFEIVLKNVELMLECGVIHSDLSAYNILWWQNKPWIIDLPQAIDIRHNPNRDLLLKRDLDNIISYFSKYMTIDKDEVYLRFNIEV